MADISRILPIIISDILRYASKEGENSNLLWPEFGHYSNYADF